MTRSLVTWTLVASLIGVIGPTRARADRVGPEIPEEPEPVEPGPPVVDPDGPDTPDAPTPALPAPADPEFERPLRPTIPRSRMADIVVETPGERSPTNITVLVGLSTLALASGLLGLHFHLETKHATEAVNADTFTGRVWMPADQALVDDAARDRTRTIWLYGVGGSLLVGAIVTLIATDPDSTITVIHPRAATSSPTIPTISPVAGGAIVGTGWQF
ncbi:MAG: hypothetical protein NT062_20710 [Proteobacteria bacterium]|nr:hypothetical protein [Pseudomonadota bacterium]